MSRRFDVIGTPVSAATRVSAQQGVLDAVAAGQGGYICFVNVHLAVAAREDGAVRRALAESVLSLPDGRPVYAAGRLKGVAPLEAVPGPDFMEAMLARRDARPLRHYFLGGRPEVLQGLTAAIARRHPTAVVAGTCSPPFRELSATEWSGILREVAAAKPDLIWVGLGAPKQELFMHRHAVELRPAVLLGVGAAFDFAAGAVRRAPGWMRRSGLEWCFRLVSEPRRRWRRYAYTNTMFLAYLARDALVPSGRSDS
jgi:N-acetylglucosaminyldiphosphoundecaprenol N-acetyl-beta-D-mannosaminyltransferase